MIRLLFKPVFFHLQVSKLAIIYHIHLRTGCFCNVGACQYFLRLSTPQLHKHFEAGHVCGDSIDIIDGQPTGSIRISFGYMSDFSDAEKFINFIKDCFVEQVGNTCNETIRSRTAENNGVLKRLFIYPVKSCAAFEVNIDSFDVMSLNSKINVTQLPVVTCSVYRY